MHAHCACTSIVHSEGGKHMDYCEAQQREIWFCNEKPLQLQVCLQEHQWPKPVGFTMKERRDCAFPNCLNTTDTGFPLCLQRRSSLEPNFISVLANKVHTFWLWWKNAACCLHAADTECLTASHAISNIDIPQEHQARRMKKGRLSMFFSVNKVRTNQRPFLLFLLQSSSKMHTINLGQTKLPLLTGPNLSCGNKV